MTGNKFLLDTNIIIAWLKGEKGIADKIDNATEVNIPIIVVGELYYGASSSIHVQRNTKEIQKITSRYTVLTIDEATTVAYGTIKSSLKKLDKPIPENDIWITAIAQRYELVLVSRDKHFKAVDGLAVKSW